MHQSSTSLIKYRLAVGFFMQNYLPGFFDNGAVGVNGLMLIQPKTALLIFAFETVITS